MAINFGKFGEIIGELYHDKAEIRRYTSVINEDGTTSNTEPQVIATDIPCRISFRYQNRDKPLKDDDDSYPVYSENKVFFYQEVEIRKGDKLFVTRYKTDKVTPISTYEGIAGMPFIYPTHTEVPFGQEGNA